MWLPQPPLSQHQLEQFAELESLALHFNERINLYSRASAEDFQSRHVAHSLALATRPFPVGSDVVDWGTGGGIPGLVLAIVFPDVRFHLVDAVSKKIRAVAAMARRLDLENVATYHSRAETWSGRATHSVSRATAPLATLWSWHERVSRSDSVGEGWPPGLICLKGGDLEQEIRDLDAVYPGLAVRSEELPPWFENRGMDDKRVVAVTDSKAAPGTGDAGRET